MLFSVAHPVRAASPPSSSRRALLAALLLALLAPLAQAEDGKRLRIGITLHPYYSYVRRNIVGDKAEVVPLIPAGFNPHAYEPRAEDIKRIGTLDVVVLKRRRPRRFRRAHDRLQRKPGIRCRGERQGAAAGRHRHGRARRRQMVNPHTFLSISASITQVNTIARELGKLDPANAKPTPATPGPAQRLRARATPWRGWNKAPPPTSASPPSTAPTTTCCANSAWKSPPWSSPRHHRAESSQLKKTIDQLKALDVKVIFSEIDFPPPTSRPSSASPG